MKKVISLVLIFSFTVFIPTLGANESEIREMWNTMTPKEQKRIRKRYERFKNMPAQKRERIKRRHKWFQALPKQERKRLKAKFKALKDLPKKERRMERRKLMKQLRQRYQKTQRGN